MTSSPNRDFRTRKATQHVSQTSKAHEQEPSKQRLDQALVQRGLTRSRSEAARAITDGRVLVDGVSVTKPGHKVVQPARVELTQPLRWASRAGHKLAGALAEFPEISVAGKLALDAGASTGGFTDVLLAHGARRVIAVDVGHDQLIDRLRVDPRVEVHEGLNLRYLEPKMISSAVDLVVADLSFISLRLVIGSLLSACATGAQLVLMIKPQFEVGREALPKTGVVTDPDARKHAVAGVVAELLAHGAQPRGLGVSALPGTHGNREYFVFAESGGATRATDGAETAGGSDGSGGFEDADFAENSGHPHGTAHAEALRWIEAQELDFTDAANPSPRH